MVDDDRFSLYKQNKINKLFGTMKPKYQNSEPM